ncbi:hypothetical protein A8C56_18850 [Niabella ginsenosidivorans]|uniref:Pyridoxamine 5-phosphate oxidase n=1 Tax=Niabella ginsenosidivorans TaxID=1176587 RepID=A0A1A9I5C7_9BACT|nr:DUF1697 domain-containing protein [Niabella ginsenosidivorans]ANH82763.1 hypothetical protein A8C56_18850 [Niabella ginsenosidivorans]
MQYIILLRGVNVGGRTIKMAALKSCFEENGYQNVQTILQTGNVIVQANEKNIAKLQKKAEAELTAAFNYPAKVLALTPEQLENIVRQYAFTNIDAGFHRYIVFTENGFEKQLVKDCGVLDKNMEAVKAGAGVVYWCVQKGYTLDSAFGKYMNKMAVKHFITNRNVNTLEKILAKCG